MDHVRAAEFQGHRQDPYLITCRGDGVVGMAAAGLTATPTGQVPVVGGAVVTHQTRDVLPTLALPSGALAHAVLTVHTLAALRAQEVTRAL